jgi:hypothetical protein
LNSPTPRAELLERERRLMRPAGLAALFGALMVAGSLVLQGSAVGQAENDVEFLTKIQENSGGFVLGGIIGGVGVALFSVPLFHLFRAAQGRTERVRGAFTALVLLGPILFGIGQAVTAVGTSRAADDFVEQEASAQASQDDSNVGADKPPKEETTTVEPSGTGGSEEESSEDEEDPEDAREQLAEDAQEDEGMRQAGQGIGTAGVLGFVFGLFYTGLWAMRTGLLSRFMGALGMALGASLILLAQVGLFGVVLWFAALGLLFLGRLPGGLPPAWGAGEAIPWPRPGEPPDGPGSGRGPGGTVEGEGREVSDESTQAPSLPPEPPEPRPELRKRKRRQ